MARCEQTGLERLAAAAAWSAKLRNLGQETCAEFEAWLAQDVHNLDAWTQVQGPLEHIDQNATAPEAMAARQAALQFASRSRKPVVLNHRRGALAGAAIGAATLVAICLWAAVRPTTYQTNLGERRLLTLADGSLVTLDSNSRLEVRLDRRARKLKLVRGQARFAVAHDTARPFSVRARDQIVVATGTDFNIDMLGPKILVTLIEGRVTVLQAPTSGISMIPRARPVVVAKLNAGQQLASTSTISFTHAAVAAQVQPASVDRAVAWETGQLVFADERLGAVVERISRYSPEPVLVEGPCADMRLSGVFNAGDVETFVDAVQRALPVRATRTSEGILLRTRPQ